MQTMKINNKKYDVPELTFRDFVTMEEQGFSVIEAFRKRSIFLIAMGFVCVVADCERDEAERLIEQHVLGGGKLEDIYSAFGEAVDRSAFFKKMLGLDEKEKKTSKTESTMTE